MSSKNIGWKLREARLERKMTQAEVVGSFITRNMLSQIESGTATPSLRTLQYLCGVLGIPMEQLMQEECEAVSDAANARDAQGTPDSHDTQEAAERLLRAKQAMRDGEAEAAAALLCPLCDKDCPFSDEAYQLSARVKLRQAREFLAHGDLRAADAAAHEAADFAVRGIYAGEDVALEARLFLRSLG